MSSELFSIGDSVEEQDITNISVQETIVVNGGHSFPSPGNMNNAPVVRETGQPVEFLKGKDGNIGWKVVSDRTLYTRGDIHSVVEHANVA